jgi:hypothetical protein
MIYEAFVEGKLEAPKHPARTVHDLYFEPKCEEFRPRTIWSLSNTYIGIQGSGSDSAIQGDGETRGVSGESVLAISLTKHGGAVRAASSHRYWHLSGSRTRGMACRCVSLIAVLTPERWRRKRAALWKAEWDMKSPVVDWMQMPGADMTQPNSWNGIFTDILSNE